MKRTNTEKSLKDIHVAKQYMTYSSRIHPPLPPPSTLIMKRRIEISRSGEYRTSNRKNSHPPHLGCRGGHGQGPSVLTWPVMC